MKRRAAFAFALTAAGLLNTAAQAQSSHPAGWYIGASLGRATVRFDDDFLSHPASNGAETFSKDDTAGIFKAYVGNRIGRHLAVEGGFADFGEFSASRTFASLAAFGPGALDFKLRARGFFLDGVGILPVGERIDLFAKAGLVHARTKTSIREAGSVSATLPRFDGGSDSELAAKLGLGASMRISQRFDVRFEWEQVFAVGDENTTGEGDIGMLSIGLAYRF